MQTLWVLTGAHADYNQYGEYFIAAFKKKPSSSQLKKLGLYVYGDIEKEFYDALINECAVSGSDGVEYSLTEIKYGERFD